jgi:hypothetical protein
MLARQSPWRRSTALHKTIMYSLGFSDGRTGYVVVPQELADHGNENVARIARERQRRGEVPAGDIITVKRSGRTRPQNAFNHCCSRGLLGDQSRC